MARSDKPSTDTSGLADLLDVVAWTLVFFLVMAAPLFTPKAVGFPMASLVYTLGLMAVAAVAATAALRGKLSVMVTGSGLALVVYAAATVMSVLFANARRDALVKGFETWLAVVPFLLLLVTIPAEPVRRRRLAGLLLTAVLAAAAVALVYGVYQYAVLYPQVEKTLETQRIMLEESFGLHDPRQFGLFRARVGSRELYSTFFLSNTFAGFMVLIAPVLIGLALDAFRARVWRTVGVAAALAALVAFNIAHTGSKGGWVALAVALAAMVLVSRRDIFKRWWFVIVPVVALLALAGLWVMFVGVAGRPPVDSMVWRLGYWHGTVEILKSWRVWLTGIGPDNFMWAYTTVKPPASQEVATPHNDLLWVLVTFGIAGLATFAWAWFRFFSRALRAVDARDVVSDSAAKAGLSVGKVILGLLVAAVLVVGFMMLEKGVPVGDSFAEGLFWLAIFPPVVLAVVLMAWPMLAGHAGQALSATRNGIVAGVAGMLVHGLVDFLWEIPGIALTALTLVVVWHALRRDTRFRQVSLRGGRALVVAGVSIAAAIAVQMLVVRPVADSRAAALAMDNLRQRYVVSVRKLEDGPPEADRMIAGQHRREMVDFFTETFLPALEGDAKSPELHQAAASMWRLLWEESSRSETKAWTAAMDNLESLARLRPDASGPHRLMAQLADARRKTLPVGDPLRDRLTARALGEFEKAVALNPTLPALHLEWARLLAAEGRLEQAAARARRALAMHERITQQGNKLTDDQRAEAQRLVG